MGVGRKEADLPPTTYLYKGDGHQPDSPLLCSSPRGERCCSSRRCCAVPSITSRRVTSAESAEEECATAASKDITRQAIFTSLSFGDRVSSMKVEPVPDAKSTRRASSIAADMVIMKESSRSLGPSQTASVQRLMTGGRPRPSDRWWHVVCARHTVGVWTVLISCLI